jgi:hypothetical protein
MPPGIPHCIFLPGKRKREMRRIFVMALFAMLVAAVGAVNPKLVMRIERPTEADLARFVGQEADIASYKPGVYLDLVVTRQEYELLRSDYPAAMITQTEARLKENLGGGRDIPGYRTYAQMVSELMQLQAEYPSLMQTQVLGTGWGATYAAQNLPNYLNFDHQIWAVKVSANVLETEDEPAFYFVGEHHAREPISTEVCMSVLTHLLENYGTDLIITNLLNSAEVWFVPLLNPDGQKIVIDQTDVWWRKNIRDNNGNQSFDHQSYGSGTDGVDLNRNYGYYWGYTSASGSFNDVTYHGESPFSEPETQVFRDFVQTRRFLAGISYHSYGEYVLFPYGYVRNIQGPDRDEMYALAQEMAALIPAVDGGYYDPMPSWQLYPVSGSSDDWIYGYTGAFAYTVEMATEFIPPAAEMTQIVANHTEAALTLLKRMNKKMLKGHVTNAETGDPLVARIYVEGIDDDPIWRTPICSDSLFGAYYRLLPTGVFNVKYMCEGFETYETLVTITDTNVTVMDAALLPSQPYELSVYVRGDFYESLGGASVSFEPGDGTVYETNADGQFQVPGFYPGQYQITVSKPGYGTLVLIRNVASPSIGLRITNAPALNENFEAGMSNWQASGNWGRTTLEAHEGSYSLADSPTGNYQSNSNSTCKLINPLALQDVQNANLQFWMKCSFPQDSDNVSLEYSLNNTTWTVLDFYTGISDWTLESYNLNSFIGGNLYLRFKLNTDGSLNGNGIFIDDFKLYMSSDFTVVPSDGVVPPVFSLTAYPNPFSAGAKVVIRSSALIADPLKVSVYNLKGQLVKSFDGLEGKAGLYEIGWDGRDANGAAVASGIYRVVAWRGGKAVAQNRLLRLK